jgi:hypothetical protein
MLMRISDADAAIVAGVIGGGFGLLGVWLGSYLGKRDTEKVRHAEKLLVTYREIEVLRNCLIAFQKNTIDKARFYRLWNQTTEKIMEALVGSGLSSKEKRRVLTAINAKWNDPAGIKELGKLSDELLERVDPGYALAARQMLTDLGIDRDTIDPVILGR